MQLQTMHMDAKARLKTQLQLCSLGCRSVCQSVDGELAYVICACVTLCCCSDRFNDAALGLAVAVTSLANFLRHCCRGMYKVNLFDSR